MNRLLMIKPILFFILAPLVAQEFDESLTLDKKSVIILPSQDSNDPNSISKKVTNIVASKAIELGRFNVIDRTQIESILAEQKFQLSGMVDDNQIIDIGSIAAADEGILIKMINFGQRGVPKKKKKKEKKEKEEKEKEPLYEWVIKEGVKAAIKEKQKKKEKYPNNIQTILEIEVRLINIETGVSKNSFLISSTFTGGNKDASLNAVLKILANQISSRLREFYLIASEVIDMSGNRVTILTGDDMGLEEGAIFEVRSPDIEKIYKGRKIQLPGKPLALIQLNNIGENSSSAEIIRKWKDNVQVGHIVNEMIYDPTSSEFSFKTNSKNFIFDAKLWWSPFSKYPWSINGHLGSLRDTRGQDNPFLGIGGGMKINLFKSQNFRISSGVSFPLYIAFKTDDEGNSVQATVFYPSINITSSKVFDSKRDMFFGIQFVGGSQFSDWSFQMESEEKEDGSIESITMDAIWESGSVIPVLDAAGLFLTVGMSFLDY